MMKKKKIGALIVGVLVLTVSIVTVAFAINDSTASLVKTSRYEELSLRNEGYKERAAKIGKKEIDDVKIVYPNNANAVSRQATNVLEIEKMEGYQENLNDGAYYISKEKMTYGALLESDHSIDLDPSIAENRIVWVTKAMYPNNIIINGGYIENAHETKYWDAETGDFIGATIKSLNEDGTINPNGVHMDKNCR